MYVCAFVCSFVSLSHSYAQSLPLSLRMLLHLSRYLCSSRMAMITSNSCVLSCILMREGSRTTQLPASVYVREGSRTTQLPASETLARVGVRVCACARVPLYVPRLRLLLVAAGGFSDHSLRVGRVGRDWAGLARAERPDAVGPP